MFIRWHKGNISPLSSSFRELRTRKLPRKCFAIYWLEFGSDPKHHLLLAPRFKHLHSPTHKLFIESFQTGCNMGIDPLKCCPMMYCKMASHSRGNVETECHSSQYFTFSTMPVKPWMWWTCGTLTLPCEEITGILHNASHLQLWSCLVQPWFYQPIRISCTLIPKCTASQS